MSPQELRIFPLAPTEYSGLAAAVPAVVAKGTPTHQKQNEKEGGCRNRVAVSYSNNRC